jgi:hypothetical protein
MEARPKILTTKGQLEERQNKRSERNALIAELQAKNSVAQAQIDKRNRQIDFLLQAQDIEQRIIAILTYLNVRQDEDRYKLLLQEIETQAIVLKTLEDPCFSTS